MKKGENGKKLEETGRKGHHAIVNPLQAKTTGVTTPSEQTQSKAELLHTAVAAGWRVHQTGGLFG